MIFHIVHMTDKILHNHFQIHFHIRFHNIFFLNFSSSFFFSFAKFVLCDFFWTFYCDSMFEFLYCSNRSLLFSSSLLLLIFILTEKNIIVFWFVFCGEVITNCSTWRKFWKKKKRNLIFSILIWFRCCGGARPLSGKKKGKNLSCKIDSTHHSFKDQSSISSKHLTYGIKWDKWKSRKNWVIIFFI